MATKKRWRHSGLRAVPNFHAQGHRKLYTDWLPVPEISVQGWKRSENLKISWEQETTVRVSHKNWILTVFIPDWSLNYISMCKGELRELCLKPTTTKRQKTGILWDRAASLCVGCLLTEMYLQIMYSLGSSDLVLWDYHIRGQSLRLAVQLKI